MSPTPATDQVVATPATDRWLAMSDVEFEALPDDNKIVLLAHSLIEQWNLLSDAERTAMEPEKRQAQHAAEAKLIEWGVL